MASPTEQPKGERLIEEADLSYTAVYHNGILYVHRDEYRNYIANKIDEESDDLQEAGAPDSATDYSCVASNIRSGTYG